MNFFGHAAVASWREVAPGRSLGSMLPDFATMCRARLVTPAASCAPDDAHVVAGIDLHHATDAVFHELAPVTALMSELDERLGALGCARGPRRATAHIGVELLLDGVLTEEAAYRDSYLAGIGHDAAIAFREPETQPRLGMLIERLRAHGVPDDLRRVDAIVLRLQRVLGGRPLLAPNADDLRAMATALAAFKPRVEVATDTVLRGLRAALG